MKLLTVSFPAVLLLTLFSGKASVYDVAPAKITAAAMAITIARADADAKTAAARPVLAPEDQAVNLYRKLQLEARGLNEASFLIAMRGYRELRKKGRLRNSNVLTIIDYTLSSLRKRLFVMDIRSGRLLYNTFVAHGMKSGGEYARKFSNAPESNESSLGFYVTMNTYKGKHGLALRLKGLERGINDNALSRGIVLHGAPYVSARYGRGLGFMGRSEGCPAVPQEEAGGIIRSISNGSAVFAYYPSQLYLGKSRLLEGSSKTFASR